jgi:hypothetical protein
MDLYPQTTTNPSPRPSGNAAEIADDGIDSDRIILSRNLRLYIREAWHVVEPSTVYLENWHIDLIAEYLQAVTAGQLSVCSSTCHLDMRKVPASRLCGRRGCGRARRYWQADQSRT